MRAVPSSALNLEKPSHEGLVAWTLNSIGLGALILRGRRRDQKVPPI